MDKRELIIEDIFYKQNDSIEEYLDLIININGKFYDFYCGNLALKKEVENFIIYERFEDLDFYKKKYLQLIITEFRYTDNNCNSYLLLCNNLLFYSSHFPTSKSNFDTQEIGLIDNIHSNDNKDSFGFFLNAKTLKLDDLAK